MNAFKSSVLLILLVFLASGAFCQETASSLFKAEEAYTSREFLRASRLFEKVTHYRKCPSDVPLKLALCYRELNDYPNAARWFAAAIDKAAAPAPTTSPWTSWLTVSAGYAVSSQVEDPSTGRSITSADIWIYYGDALKSLGQYVNAKAAYTHGLDSLHSPKADSLHGSIADKIAGCDSAIVWLHSGSDYFLANFTSLNTAHSDWGALWYGSHQIVFTSDSVRTSAFGPVAEGRKVSRESSFDAALSGRPIQKLYVVDSSAMDSLSLSSAAIKGMSPVINQNLYHDGALTFSPSGDTAWYTLTSAGSTNNPLEKIKFKEGRQTHTLHLMRLELWYTSKDSAGNWGTPHAFAYNHSSKYSVGQPALSKDGHILYFASDMPGGYGKTDIWYCLLRDDGTWSTPVNCGPLVNSAEDEGFPEVGTDGNLYFASKGHIGMGGFDIFQAIGSLNDWNVVVNLKAPINSCGDDFYFNMKDNYSGFLSSNRPGGKGSDDIYLFTYLRPLPDMVGTDPVAPLGIPIASGSPYFAALVAPPLPVSAQNPEPDVAEADGPAPTRKLKSSKPGVPPREISPYVVVKTVAVDWLSGQPLEGAEILWNLRNVPAGPLTRKHITRVAAPMTAIQASYSAGDQELVDEETDYVATSGTAIHSSGTRALAGSDADYQSMITGENGINYLKVDRGTIIDDSAAKTGYASDRALVNTAKMIDLDTVTVLLRLKKNPSAGDLFVFHQLYFDFNKYNIRKDAALELDRLVDYLHQYPTIIIDLSAHTDSRGNDDYNQQLSEKRANSARQYLMQHGIAIHRIITHGYGEALPVNGCVNGVPCTEDEFQMNRRIEIKILRM
jgi:outer membrane protein OmpA-like peptidoglycan-associated protein